MRDLGNLHRAGAPTDAPYPAGYRAWVRVSGRPHYHQMGPSRLGGGRPMSTIFVFKGFIFLGYMQVSLWPVFIANQLYDCVKKH